MAFARAKLILMDGYKPHWPKFPDLGHLSLFNKLLAAGYGIYFIVVFVVCFIVIVVLLHKLAKLFIGRLVMLFS